MQVFVVPPQALLVTPLAEVGGECHLQGQRLPRAGTLRAAERVRYHGVATAQQSLNVLAFARHTLIRDSPRTA